MADKTGISWTDRTYNPWWGCTKVSAGCKNCYAETVARRGGRNVWGPGAQREMKPSSAKCVRRWNEEAAGGAASVRGNGPLLVFTGSMCDWAEDRPDLVEPRARMWQLIAECKHLEFQMLTKRPENIERMLPPDWGHGYPNVWLGTSIEDMRVAQRADILRNIPAVVRYISYEPALGPLNDLDLTSIDWVIFGGESGVGYRAMDPQWARDMRDKCKAAGVAFFFKQHADRWPGYRIALDGSIIREFPVPRVVQPDAA